VKKMSKREIPETSELTSKISALFASGEFSMDKAVRDIEKMLENIKNGNVTYTNDVAPVVTYKKRRKWIK
jgi:hypothetical protein